MKEPSDDCMFWPSAKLHREQSITVSVLGHVLVDRMYTAPGNTSLAPLHFGVICYVVLVSGTKTFIKFVENFVWLSHLRMKGRETN